MEFTFNNIFDVVNSRSVSRKDKKVAVSRFLKQQAGKKASTDEEAEALEKLTEIRKVYIKQDKMEK